MQTLTLRHLHSDADYQAGFATMQALRPHLGDAVAFAAQARRQASQGYRLLAAWQEDQVLGLAGYRLQENLLYGRFLYLDDLVTADLSRNQGVGAQLMAAMQEMARQQGCAHFVLDTGLGNALAQRFYFRQGMLSKGMHFCQVL
ncbi:GNAT family N-acetyltransferase [Comamonas sp. GB3 AK4-5]|uniref:GNAT family N-acetyltransferase n=1 Tax=Comamonas sp. GB3 AK4-5 TaxID=3231487 RepID=UPI00351DC857